MNILDLTDFYVCPKQRKKASAFLRQFADRLPDDERTRVLTTPIHAVSGFKKNLLIGAEGKKLTMMVNLRSRTLRVINEELPEGATP